MRRRSLAGAAPGLALLVALVAGGIIGNTLLLAQADETLPVGRLSARVEPGPSAAAPAAHRPSQAPPSSPAASPADDDPLPSRQTRRSATAPPRAAKSPTSPAARDAQETPSRSPSADDDGNHEEVEADD